MAGNSGGNPAPAWAVPAAIVVLVLIIGIVAWRSLGRNHNDAGPPMVVHPGMYDFKQAAANGTLGRPPTELKNAH